MGNKREVMAMNRTKLDVVLVECFWMDWILREILYENKLPRVQVKAIHTLTAPSPFEMATHLNESPDASMSLLERVMPGTSGGKD